MPLTRPNRRVIGEPRGSISPFTWSQLKTRRCKNSENARTLALSFLSPLFSLSLSLPLPSSFSPFSLQRYYFVPSFFPLFISFYFSSSVHLAFPPGQLAARAFMACFMARPTFNDPFYERYVRDSVIRGLRCSFFERAAAIRLVCQVLNPLTPLRGEVNSSYYFSWQRFPLSSHHFDLIEKFIRYLYQR